MWCFFSLNHRLNLFGRLHLAHLDSRYADSGNVGMLNCVAALEWIERNTLRNLVAILAM
jgi:para-nitrobenzyl esterase